MLTEYQISVPTRFKSTLEAYLFLVAKLTEIRTQYVQQENEDEHNRDMVSILEREALTPLENILNRQQQSQFDTTNPVQIDIEEFCDILKRLSATLGFSRKTAIDQLITALRRATITQEVSVAPQTQGYVQAIRTRENDRMLSHLWQFLLQEFRTNDLVSISNQEINTTTINFFQKTEDSVVEDYVDDYIKELKNEARNNPRKKVLAEESKTLLIDIRKKMKQNISSVDQEILSLTAKKAVDLVKETNATNLSELKKLTDRYSVRRSRSMQVVMGLTAVLASAAIVLAAASVITPIGATVCVGLAACGFYMAYKKRKKGVAKDILKIDEKATGVIAAPTA